ncbi:MAG: NADH-quinone oxidoreductase subunit M [Acidobacteria bacterium]|nr:NADH-quinone oxidoreductase subunit M [Acidobacteriota bacterium]MBV9434511.1 NADH-quinone oxidoreductase subunit M [Acidobacteriota bacterium]
MSGMILTLITFVPLAGAVLLMFMPRNDRALKWTALVISLLAFVLSLHLPAHWSSGAPGFQFVVDAQWISSPNIHYHLGVDGISVWLVLLTTFLTPFCVLISWNSVHGPLKEFFVLMLILETAMIGVFVALDLFLFYVFWEATLIPMALMIGMYGHERRVYAAVKFFLYTMLASVFMLASIIWFYVQTQSFDYITILNAIHSHQIAGFDRAAELLFFGFFLGFAVKVPLFPFHTWLPDAHVEAPTAGSVLLAGVLLKMGVYGLLRFNVTLFPVQAHEHAKWINALALIGIVYGALVALVQPNMKKLVAYSSVSHLGFCVLGIFTFTQIGTDGAVYQMLNHGISTGALFMLLGMLYERRHTYEIKEYGGLATPMPVYSTLFLMILLSSVGLPLLNGFVGEFLILSGAFSAWKWYGVIGTTGVIWSAGYLLWLYQRTFYGEVHNSVNASLPDANGRERLSLIPMVAMALIMGVASPLWIRMIDPSVNDSLRRSATYAAAVSHPAVTTIAASTRGQ